jgi:hypothetical protein
METTPVRVWSGVYEALQVYAKAKGQDTSGVASTELMSSLFTKEDIPEEAQVLLAREFFQALAEGISQGKDELAKWSVAMLKAAKTGKGQ